MELKDWLGVISLGISVLSSAIAVGLWLRKGGARDASLDHRLGTAATKDDLAKYVTQENLTKALEHALAQAALRYHEKTAAHDLVDKVSKEIYDRINRLHETVQTAVTNVATTTQTKTEQLNIQVHVLQEGLTSVTDGLDALEKIVAELMTKNADHGARIAAQEQMRVAFESLRVQVAKIEGLLTKGGKLP